MDGCSSMIQWGNMYQHHHHHHHHHQGLEMPGSVSLILDPIHEDVHHQDILPWSEGAQRDHMCSSSFPMISCPLLLSGLMNNNNIIAQSQQPFDNNKGTTSSGNSIDQQSFECLLSTNSNTDTSAEDNNDDGISMIFSDCRRNLLNFSSNENATNNEKNNPNKKRNCMEVIHQDQDDRHQLPLFSITKENNSSACTTNLRGNNKRQKINTNNNDFEKCGARKLVSSSNISFQQGSSSGSSVEEPDAEAIQQMKEMIYRAAAFRPVNFGVEMAERPKRKNVRISHDPQTVAARQRRERISERLRVLQKLVPGGSKMDTASMLDEAANYLKFLRNQVKALEALGNNKVDQQYHYSPNLSTNHLFPPINLQFSTMPFIMQPTNNSFTTTPTQFSLQNPNHVHVLPKS